MNDHFYSNHSTAGKLGLWPMILRATATEIDCLLTRDIAEWNVKPRLPVVQVTQLSLFGLMGVRSQAPDVWLDVLRDPGKVERSLGQTYRAGKQAWLKALEVKSKPARVKALADLGATRRPAEKLVRLVEKSLGLGEPRLSDLGVTDVQEAISQWTALVSNFYGPKFDAQPDPSSEHLAAFTVATVAGGTETRPTLSAKEISLTRIACRLGSKKAKGDGQETTAIKRSRKLLRELAQHLPKQQG